MTGDVGLKLVHQLMAAFSTLSRLEIFFGIALAWTDLQAALVAAEAEIDHLRRLLDGGEPDERAA